tara:strand:- start:1041 stop:1688 length:648 start_codon:yes stop_codon:yes gene_type:complete
MRLSQTQADVDDHRKRILGKNRLSGHGVGAAWQSERLHPRADGENVWSQSAKHVPTYPHIGETFTQGTTYARQRALTPGTTSGGRSSLRKRRTGEAQSPSETQIIIRWDVRNDGDATANASLRLRQGATRIIATTQPIEVAPTQQKSLYMLWNIPRNIALGGHNYQLDIMQTWTVDGRRATKVSGTHAVTIDVVAGKRFSQWDRQAEDVDLDIGI